MSGPRGPVPQVPERRARPSGWTTRGRRRWDLPPNVTKVLLALIPILAGIAANGYAR
jgi:cell division protein FtsB